MTKKYNSFLKRKLQEGSDTGFDPIWMPDFLFPFQSHLDEWALRKGRAAVLADCGLGKTPMLLVWAENVLRKTNKPVLIVTPLAVSFQTIREGEKFGIEVTRSQDGTHKGGIVVTNYQRLHHFDPDDFGGIVCDESSAIKNEKSKTKGEVAEFLRRIPYRLLCTATAAPNDYHELGTSSEVLGYLGYQDMLTKFFKEESKKDHLGWGRKTYRFRGHAEHPFWRWVVSWARACRKPSDLGFSDEGFDLPPLVKKEHIITTKAIRDGMLFSMPAKDLPEQREERRLTMKDRCEWVADRVSGHSEPCVIWCHLNPEGDMLEKMIPDALQVKGSMSDDAKEERLLAFTNGELRVLVIKPKIGAWGLNWQHCRKIITFPSHSFEGTYQSIRRCWRFGQTKPVEVDIVTTEGEVAVMRNLNAKAERASVMFDSLTKYMSDELKIDRGKNFTKQSEVPTWLIK